MTSARSKTAAVGGGVAGLPLEAEVVGLAGEVVADHHGLRVERAAGVDDGREYVVLDVDQLEGVTRGVPVLGDDERDLLSLEAHLVRGQDRLPVARQRRHPGQAALREHGAGDHRAHLRVGLGGQGVDGDDPGMRER